MTDFAFNNYCFNCDKLCSHNSIYCSDECKWADERQSTQIKDQFSNTDGEKTVEEELVSPILNPSYHYNNNNYLLSDKRSSLSPLMLAATEKDDESLIGTQNPSLEYSKLDLNYPVISENSSISEKLPSTSNNYRKWLTACL